MFTKDSILSIECPTPSLLMKQVLNEVKSLTPLSVAERTFFIGLLVLLLVIVLAFLKFKPSETAPDIKDNQQILKLTHSDQ